MGNGILYANETTWNRGKCLQIDYFIVVGMIFGISIKLVLSIKRLEPQMKLNRVRHRMLWTNNRKLSCVFHFIGSKLNEVFHSSSRFTVYHDWNERAAQFIALPGHTAYSIHAVLCIKFKFVKLRSCEFWAHKNEHKNQHRKIQSNGERKLSEFSLAKTRVYRNQNSSKTTKKNNRKVL